MDQPTSIPIHPNQLTKPQKYCSKTTSDRFSFYPNWNQSFVRRHHIESQSKTTFHVRPHIYLCQFNIHYLVALFIHVHYFMRLLDEVEPTPGWRCREGLYHTVQCFCNSAKIIFSVKNYSIRGWDFV